MRLKHCPFCGETERIRLYNPVSQSGSLYQIVCDACGALGPFGASMVSPDVAKQAAIDGWNDRITHEEDVALRVAFSLSTGL